MRRGLDAFRIAQQFSRSTDVRLLRDLFARPDVAIAGRDGTIAQSGGTGSTALHPTTGAIVASGDLIRHDLTIPGVGVLPMSFAQGARTNLLRYSEVFNNAAWTATAAADISDGISPWGAVAQLFIPNNSVVVLGAAESQSIAKAASSITYALTLYVRYGGLTSLTVQVDAGSSGNSAKFNCNTITGVCGSVTRFGTFSDGGVTSTPLAGGWHRLSFIVTTGAEAAVRVMLLNNDIGDGINGYYITGISLSAASFPGLHIPTAAAALTRAADNILWTPPSVPAVCDIVSVFAQYGPSGDSGVVQRTMDGGTNQRPNMQRIGVGTWRAYAKNTAAATIAGPAFSFTPNHGGVNILTARFTATGITGAPGNSAFPGEAAISSAPWVHDQTLRIGATTEPALGFVGLVIVPGGLTDAERSALARLTAGRLSYVG